MIYFEVGALILVIALISVSDLIYRRLSKGRHSGSRFRGFSSRMRNPRFAKPSSTVRPGAGAGASPPGEVSGPTEFVRVKLRSGRVVEGWRTLGDTGTSGSLDDAFDLDVSKAFDPNGNPMSFPSDSFIVFSSQIEHLDVLDGSSERQPKREVAAAHEGSAAPITASIAPVPTQTSIPETPPAPDKSEEKMAASVSSEGLGKVIQMPEPEEVRDNPPATLVPAPEPVRERRPRPTQSTTPIPDRARKKDVAPTPRRRARPLFWMGTVVALLVIALIVDGLFTFLSLSNALDSARGHLRGGSRALLSGHYQAADAEFRGAVADSGTADQLQGHPSFWVATHVPYFSRDPLALAALARSSDFASQAGLVAVQAVHAMGSPADGLAAAVYRNGQINLNASQRGARFFGDIEGYLGDALTTLRGAPPPIFTPVQAALTLAAGKMAEAKDAIHKTGSLVQALPSLFGRDQTRHYLLLFDNPSIARGSGGPIDFFGIMTAKSGHLSVGEIRPVDVLPASTAPESLAPDWFRRAYARAGAFRGWEELTRSPTFSVVAPIAQSLYQSATGTTVDGVVQMDPVALGLMTRAVGAVRQPAFDVAVNAKNAVRVLTHDVYVHFGTDELGRDQYVAGLIEDVWNRVSRGDATAPELATALGDSSGGSHFTMYSSSKSDERALDQVGVGAAFSTLEPNVQMALTNNKTFSRIGYYQRREISTVAELDRKGRAFVKTTVTMRNTAPPGPARILVRNLQSGQDRSDLALIIPEHATVQRVSMGGETQKYDLGFEGTNRRALLPVTVGPGKTVRVVFTYVIPHAANLNASGGVFRFATVPQATANPDHTSVTVVPPHGLQVLESGSIGGVADGESYVASDSAGGPLKVVVALVPPP